MRILVMIHGYPPIQNAGAEWMLHEMLKFLKQSGHDIEVVLPISNLDPYDFEGIRVNKDEFFTTTKKIQAADLVISHLDRAGKALNYCEFYHKPFVQVMHNCNSYEILRAKHKDIGQGRWVYMIFNSLYTQNSLRYPGSNRPGSMGYGRR